MVVVVCYGIGPIRSAVWTIDARRRSGSVVMNRETLTLESIAKNTERKAALISDDE